MRNLHVHPPVLLDPRPMPSPAALQLAPRLSDLAGRRLLFFDNGHLSRAEGARSIVYPTLGKRLQELYGVEASLHSWQTPSALRQGALRQLAGKMATTGIDGVVLALCDTGHMASIIVLAWELERLGIPTLTLCRGQTLYAAAAMTQSVLPGLPLSSLSATPQMSEAEIAAEVFWIAGEVGDSLTSTPDELEASFLDKFVPASRRLHATGRGELALWQPQFVDLDEANNRVTVDPSRYMTELYDAICDSGLGDGLPILPPTPARVEAMLAHTDREASEPLIAHCFPSGSPLTVGTLAINAVMAGCRPALFPLLITAVEAAADPQYRLAQMTVSPEPGGHAIIVRGPLADAVGLASEAGCLGPGHRANLTLSRALNLSLMHASGALSGRFSLNAIGTPAQLALCCAENIQMSSWFKQQNQPGEIPSTAVTVLRCTSPQAVAIRHDTGADDMLRYLADVATTLRRYHASTSPGLLVLLNPAHAAVISAAGWRKSDVQQYFFDHWLCARQAPNQDVPGQGLNPLDANPGTDDVIVVVTGAPGFYSMIGLPCGQSRAVTRVVTSHHGRPLHGIVEARH